MGDACPLSKKLGDAVSPRPRPTTPLLLVASRRRGEAGGTVYSKPTPGYKLHVFGKKQDVAPGGGETICPPPDGSSTRGRSTSARGLIRNPHLAKLQAASVPVA